jgi:flagellar biosynthesis protein FliQ
MMSADFVIRLAEQGVYMILIVCGPLLLLSLAVGLIISIFQATTQIQEQTLAFVPKIVAVLVGLVFFGPWMLSKMVSYAHDILSNLTQFIG